MSAGVKVGADGRVFMMLMQLLTLDALPPEPPSLELRERLDVIVSWESYTKFY